MYVIVNICITTYASSNCWLQNALIYDTYIENAISTHLYDVSWIHSFKPIYYHMTVMVEYGKLNFKIQNWGYHPSVASKIILI